MSGRRPAPRARRRPSRARRRLRLLGPIAVVAVVAFLYYRPLSTYLSTRDQLASRRAEVAALESEKARVDAAVLRAQSLEALARQARRIGRVRPGEQLFIVKGIDAWRRAHPNVP
ncbi:MAG: septum formation initiator family protein [Gaiellales bacterium]